MLLYSRQYAIVQYRHYALEYCLAYKEFDHLKRSVFISNALICTHSQFNVLSGGLTECLVESWHLGVTTAGSLHTRTLLSIPCIVDHLSIKH